MPVIMLKSLIKMKRILNPKVNQSYSVVSLQILKILVFQAGFFLMFCLVFAVNCYHYSEYTIDDFKARMDNKNVNPMFFTVLDITAYTY